VLIVSVASVLLVWTFVIQSFNVIFLSFVDVGCFAVAVTRIAIIYLSCIYYRSHSYIKSF